MTQGATICAGAFLPQVNYNTAKVETTCVCVCVCMRTCVLSSVRLFAIPWTVAHQAPFSMLFSRQEYWSGLPFPTPGE